MDQLITICADVGSVAKGNFAWWSSNGESGDSPSALATHVQKSLANGYPVALGFECPLFVPLLDDEKSLTNARPGEGSRAWSAGAGCGALATGLVQVAWILQEVRRGLARPAEPFLSWDAFVARESGLFLWEAFVSGKAKGDTHIADAKLGAETFMRALPDPTLHNAVVCSSPIYSLLGAALLRTGWSTDLRVLQEACLVLRASAA